uniref:Uncharacterized protein n=1 Tax=Zonotrichia albicollis TaxID=44394 RepID=A0A8D2MA28_ZONAL
MAAHVSGVTSPLALSQLPHPDIPAPHFLRAGSPGSTGNVRHDPGSRDTLCQGLPTLLKPFPVCCPCIPWQLSLSSFPGAPPGPARPP